MAMMSADERQLILVIDDDPDVRETLGTLLEQQGFATIRAAGAEDALEVLKSGTRPDLILLDLMMPHMSGWEFREAQLANETIAGIPVVVLTASRSEDEPADVETVLYKPVQVAELLATIDRNLASQ